MPKQPALKEFHGGQHIHDHCRKNWSAPSADRFAAMKQSHPYGIRCAVIDHIHLFVIEFPLHYSIYNIRKTKES
jgi:hypothetical protein